LLIVNHLQYVFDSSLTDIPLSCRHYLEDQEVSALSLQLLQNCLVYMNTLMVQEILYHNNQYLLKKMTPEDFRGLTPLFYNHVNPYGTFRIKMNQRIPIKLNVS
ncbi:Tn3 family transposase, partial [Bacillus thuringiensis]|nr:Tn3 family transposase [Bacillus thuringiensis]